MHAEGKNFPREAGNGWYLKIISSLVPLDELWREGKSNARGRWHEAEQIQPL